MKAKSKKSLDLLRNINPEGEPLTVEKLKAFPGCEHYTDQQALEIVQSLEKLSLICYGLAKEEKSHLIDNQLVVYLDNDPQTKNIAA